MGSDCRLGYDHRVVELGAAVNVSDFPPLDGVKECPACGRPTDWAWTGSLYLSAAPRIGIRFCNGHCAELCASGADRTGDIRHMHRQCPRCGATWLEQCRMVVDGPDPNVQGPKFVEHTP